MEKLDLDWLDPNKPTRCIYGQMTGDCVSYRAKELMDEACIIVTNNVHGVCFFSGNTFRDIKKSLNGKNEGQGWYERMSLKRNYSHLSALEAYICLKDAKKKNIIEFLKGNTNKLKLS